MKVSILEMCIRDRGAEDADKFNSQNITGVKVQWEPGQEFKNLRDDAEFNLVASRSAQAAGIKAIKEGKTNVDLNAPTTPDNTPGGSTPGGSDTEPRLRLHNCSYPFPRPR